MKAFLQYLVYLCTGKTVQQQLAAKALPIIHREEWRAAHRRIRGDQKRQEAVDYLGDKWLLHPANHVQRKSALLALSNAAQKA